MLALFLLGDSDGGPAGFNYLDPGLILKHDAGTTSAVEPYTAPTKVRRSSTTRGKVG